MADQKRVLVVGHDAYRAGSQICLLHILRWLVGHYPAEFSLLLKRGGDLVEVYSAVVRTRVLQAPIVDGARWRSISRRVVRRLLGPRARIVADSEAIDLVYANSVPTLDIALDLARSRSCPVICHIHELDLAIRRFFSVERFQQMQRGIDCFIAASNAVSHNLVANHGVEAERIHLVYEAIAYPLPRLEAGAAAVLREGLGIPPGAFIVGGCGTMDWRKAPEIFLQIARSLGERALPRPVHFVWVGGQTAGWERDVLDHDVARMGLAKVVHFVGPQAEPARYFSLFDVFLLTSREDPFPLVCLEAAALAIPTICFADAGGIPEFVGDDAGFVVPYLDIARACDRIRLLLTSEELRLRLGRCAAERVKQHEVGVIGPQIAGVLDRFLR